MWYGSTWQQFCWENQKARHESTRKVLSNIPCYTFQVILYDSFHAIEFDGQVVQADAFDSPDNAVRNESTMFFLDDTRPVPHGTRTKEGSNSIPSETHGFLSLRKGIGMTSAWLSRDECSL